MKGINIKNKIIYGDFQTPISLTHDICNLLVKQNVAPSTIIEPTCGTGNFIKTSSNYFPSSNIFGYEINNNYILKLANDPICKNNSKIKILEKNFFSTDWSKELEEKNESILILGNLPWVTNATQGLLSSNNLPIKSNFLKFNGLDAITGKSNFDVSEWMLISILQSLKYRKSEIAILIKTNVARKIFTYMQKNNFFVNKSSIYEIDAKKYFNASVSSCLFHTKLNFSNKISNSCSVYNVMNKSSIHNIVYLDEILQNNDKLSNDVFTKIIGISPQKWRSGIKHDAAKIMELREINGIIKNGFGDVVNIESTYMFPFLKGSDVAQGRIQENRSVILPQKNVGEDTQNISKYAPLTWEYLMQHAHILDARKSIIYKKNPRFSIFGVGEYTFKMWKIAICSLYKKLTFQLIGPIRNKPCIFDDTVYYISFDTQHEARSIYSVLISDEISTSLNKLIFWDDKRPIKTSILNRINWQYAMNV
jgi:hypothetical protein